MPIFFMNANGSALECGMNNKANIDDRESQNIDEQIMLTIKSSIDDFAATVGASDNHKIRSIKKATSFPVSEILAMAQMSGCSYLRVYNGFDANGQYVTYIAPVTDSFETFLKQDLTDGSTLSSSCCHCNPCNTDHILNFGS